MGANDDLLDRVLSHSVYLERYKAGVVRRLMETLNATEPAVEEQLTRRLSTILARGGYDAGPETAARIDELLRMVGQIRGKAYAEASAYLFSEFERLAGYEAEWQLATLREVIPIQFDELATPTAAQLRAAVFSKPFNGHLMRDWADGLAPADLDRIERAVKTGVLEGKTVADITGDIIGDDGALEASRRGAEAVARTAVNHVVTQARTETYAANSDVIRKERYTATLDGRTTTQCAALDGKLFDIGEGPMTPRHWNCRSVRVPVIDGVKLIGDRPTVTDTRTRREREVDFRADAKAKAGERWSSMSDRQRREAIANQRQAWAAENIGGAPKETTYEAWLREQPAKFQDEVLGPSRGALFRRGGLSLDRFVNERGRELTLDELRKKDSAAFERAGL